MTRNEKFVIYTVLGTVLVMSLQAFVPAMKSMDRAALILISTLLFFIFKVLTVKELEEIPWNIILLFSGAMSIGFCLWKTGAGICVKHRHLCPNHDQLHHERASHRHLATGVACYSRVHGGSA